MKVKVHLNRGEALEKITTNGLKKPLFLIQNFGRVKMRNPLCLLPGSSDIPPYGVILHVLNFWTAMW